jgi:uncharacterized protein (DUF2235 family)
VPKKSSASGRNIIVCLDGANSEHAANTDVVCRCAVKVSRLRRLSHHHAGVQSRMKIRHDAPGCAL